MTKTKAGNLNTKVTKSLAVLLLHSMVAVKALTAELSHYGMLAAFK